MRSAEGIKLSSLREIGVPGETIPQILAERAKTMGEETFFRHKRLGIWQKYSFSDVYQRTARFALGLKRLGFHRGDVLAIIGENEPELYIAEFAAQALGGIAVVLFPDTTSEEMKSIVSDCGARFLVVEDQEQVDKALEVREGLDTVERVIYWDPRCMWQYHDPWLMEFAAVEEIGNDWSRHGEFESEVAHGHADDPAVICYTSGTTGTPKGAVLTFRYLVDNAFRIVDAVGVRPRSQYLTYISPAWAAEQILGVTLGVLMPLVVNFPEEPETVLRDLREVGSEILLFSPRQWENLVATVEARMMEASRVRRSWYEWALRTGRRAAIARMEGRRLSFLEKLQYLFAELTMLAPLRDRLGLTGAYLTVSGGSALSPEVFDFYHSLGILLRNVYGLTETGFLTLHTGERFDPETIGTWLTVRQGIAPPLEFRLGQDGELLVRGGTQFLGYYRRPEETAEKYDSEGWFRTGDAVFIREDGQFVYLDRAKDLRELSEGKRFSPQFVEVRLRFSPFIRDAIVVGDRSRPYPAALIDIDAETVGRWATNKRLAYTTHADLSQKPEVLSLIKGELEAINRRLPPETRIRRFAILPKPLDPDEGDLTRTRKLRRSFLESRFSGLIDALYAGSGDPYILEVPVKYQDGRVGTVRSKVVICTLEP
jgi:long-chain acyl-CoA synthetase